jgi:hypothetical protein
MKKAVTLHPYLAAFSLAILYFLFNLHFLQQYVDSDSYVYVHNIYRAVADPDYILFNPHHLHLEIGGEKFHAWMVENFGRYGFTDLLFNLKLRSLLAACIGIFFAVLYFRDVTGRIVWGALGGLLIGFCHGYLHYSTKVDTGIFPAAAYIAIAWILNRIGENRSRGVLFMSLAGGAFFFLGIMAHQYILISCAIGGICIALPPFLFRQSVSPSPFSIIKPQRPKPLIDSKPRIRWASFLILAVFGALFTIGGYFYAGKSRYNLSFGEPTPAVSRGLWRESTFQRWLLSYSVDKKWGYGFRLFNPRAPARGILEAFLSRGNLSKLYTDKLNLPFDMDHPFSPDAFVPNQSVFFTLISVAGSLLFFPMLVKRYGRRFLFLFFSLGANAAFFTYWEPGYFEFWLIPSVQIAALVILLLNALAEKLSFLGPVLGKAVRMPFYAYVLFIAFLFASHNMLYYLVPHSRIVVSDGVASSIYNEDEFKKLYAAPYYKHPGNVFQDVYQTAPGSFMPASGSGRD